MSTVDSAIARELKQTKPFGSVAEEAAVGLLRTAQVVRRQFELVTENAGISLGQYYVLRILRGAGEPGLPTLEIVERMIERAPGITRMIDRLIAKGWVERERGDEDRRVVFCRITPGGRAIVDRLDGPIGDAHLATLDMLSERQQQQLVRLLDAVRAGLAERDAT